MCLKLPGSVHFHQEEVKYNLKNKLLIKKWIKTIIAENKAKLEELNFIFCSDQYLHQINMQYLQHDTFTDIITFDNREKKEEPILGDIFISIDRVEENSKKFSINFEDELHRVIIHGVLHLLGWKDKTKTEQEAMRKEEDSCLQKLKVSLNTIHA
jgi:rRNA maturation RNase YbeY